MTATPDREPTLADIAQQISELRNISQQISELRADMEQSRQDLEMRLDKSRQELKAEVERWDERFFQFTRDNLTTSRTIIITAGSVVILSPVLQAFALAIQTVVNRLLGIDAPQ
jgi:ABC-type lipoprotein release transport system permease subunit